MKNICFFLLLFLQFISFSQKVNSDNIQIEKERLDSINVALKNPISDSLRFVLVGRIISYYNIRNADSALFYSFKQLELAQKNNKKLSQSSALGNIAYLQMLLGRYPESLDYWQKAIELAEDPRSEGSSFILPTDSNFLEQRRVLLIRHYRNFGHLFGETQNFKQQIYYYRRSIALCFETNNSFEDGMTYFNLSSLYAGLYNSNFYMPDSALYYAEKAKFILEKSRNSWNSGNYYNVGQVYLEKGQMDSALFNFHQGLSIACQENNPRLEVRNQSGLADFYIKQRDKDSSLFYARKALEGFLVSSAKKNLNLTLGKAYENLVAAFELNNQPDSVEAYIRLAKQANDSFNRTYITNLTAFQNKLYEDQLRLKQKEKEQVAYQAMIRSYLLAGGIVLFAFLSLVFYRNARMRQKAQNKIEKAYSELEATQHQLVQQEKMASLGELTAGIAHEIQNPLNFVNNFSEVNTELIEEADQEIDNGNISEVKSILKDIKENEQKINHHGKRADAIVKGMLQHSRSNSGHKEPTDINALADEYLRLSYHGMRAKDKSFAAEYKTEFDPNLPKINVVPQDIGRVILNLINNAFYVVDVRKKLQSDGYEPSVLVSTKKYADKIVISVKDNGHGIPDSIKDKIFQPFFTTKPTGQGTGLGLSLAYDIVKAHGGELKVETKEGEGSEFLINLPV